MFQPRPCASHHSRDAVHALTATFHVIVITRDSTWHGDSNDNDEAGHRSLVSVGEAGNIGEDGNVKRRKYSGEDINVERNGEQVYDGVSEVGTGGEHGSVANSPTAQNLLSLFVLLEGS